METAGASRTMAAVFDCRRSELTRRLVLHSINQDKEHHNRKNTCDDPDHCYRVHSLSFHRNSQLLPVYYPSKVTMFLSSPITAGPIVTIKTVGKINNTMGNTSLMAAFAPISSAFCLRSVRRDSANVANATASGVPKRSVCTSMATNWRKLSKSSRSANAFQDSILGTPARCSKLICRNSWLISGCVKLSS